MTNKEKKEWLGVKYPLTIIRDRYDGVYSRACWLAFPLDYDEIPEDVNGDDVVCSLFWQTYKEPVGKGAYANDAVIDLMERMEAPEFPEESELIEEVCRWLCEYAGYYKGKDMEAVNNHLFKLSQRLKSLRPSWKPSEEQMDRLVSIVAALRKDDCDDMADFLAEIYHGLEKL